MTEQEARGFANITIDRAQRKGSPLAVFAMDDRLRNVDLSTKQGSRTMKLNSAMCVGVYCPNANVVDIVEDILYFFERCENEVRFR